MKRIVLLMVGILLAMVVAAPTGYAQSNGGAPEDASGTVVVNPGDYPGSCEFPFSLEFSGKAKTIELPNGGFIFTSPGLDVTITNLDNLENDHPLFRSAVRHTQEVHPDLNVVGEAANGQEALELSRRLRPELVLMDLRMPVMDGVAATQAVKWEFPETLVLIFTAVDESAGLSAPWRRVPPDTCSKMLPLPG